MQTVILKVTGMTCGGCTSAVTRALVAVDGVHNVNISLAGGETKVDFDENITSAEKLTAAVQDAGYGINEDIGEPEVEKKNMEGKAGCC